MSEIEQYLSMPEFVANQLPPEVSAWFEQVLNRQQQQIFRLREFLEPAITANKDAPNQSFNPLE